MDELIGQFMAVTGCPADEAEFYLETAQRDLDSAIDLYYEEKKVSNVDVAEEEMAEPEDWEQSRHHFIKSLPLEEEHVKVSSEKKTTSGAKQTRTSSNRMVTLADLKQEDDEYIHGNKQPQQYYAGGEKSGMLVEQPDDKKAGSFIENIFQRARRGVRQAFGGEDEEGSEEDEHESSFRQTKPKQPPAFTGTGYKLGDEQSSSVLLTETSPHNNASKKLENQSSEESVKTMKKKLTFWRNGFTIDEGELHQYDKPENQQFLKALSEGQVPAGFGAQIGQKVDISIDHKMDEDFQERVKKPTTQAFIGSGYRLGNIAPSVASTSTSNTSANLLRETKQPPPIKDDQPITSVQIRMADGSRLVAKFNHSNTIADVRNFINASNPIENTRRYVLLTGFPQKELKDESSNLVAAGLLNAVITQKYC